MSQANSYYNVEDEGDLTETPVTGPIKDVLTPEMVVLIVNDFDKKIWLWKGSNAKVRKKFIAARKSQDLRGERGLTYKVDSIDHGDEPAEFIQLIGGPVASASSDVVEEISSFVPTTLAAPAAAAPAKPAGFQPAFSPPTPAAPAPAQPAPTPAIVEIPKPVQPSIPAPVQPSAPAPTPQAAPEASSSIQNLNVEESVKQILARITAMPLPSGAVRELICIGPYVFSEIESKQTFLGKETVEKRLELMTSLPEGEFLAQTYVPRLLINEGRVMGIELLKMGEDLSPGAQIQSLKIRFQK